MNLIIAALILFLSGNAWALTSQYVPVTNQGSNGSGQSPTFQNSDIFDNVSTHNVGIGTSIPAGNLDMGSSGSICLGGVCDAVWPAGGAQLWSLVGAGPRINYTSNVGIGSSNPGQLLDVGGTVRATSIVPNPSSPASNFNTIGGLSLVARATPTSVSSFTLSGLSPNVDYILFIDTTQNTTGNSFFTIDFNGDSGNNYVYTGNVVYGTGTQDNQGSNSSSSILINNSSAAVGHPSQSFVYIRGTGNYVSVLSLGAGNQGSTSYAWAGVYSGEYSGSAGLSSLTVLDSAGTMTGTVSLYKAN